MFIPLGKRFILNLFLCTFFVLGVTSCFPGLFLSPDLYEQDVPTGVVGQDYQYDLEYEDSNNEIEFHVTQGSLPPGISLSQVGSLFGIPSEAGDYEFTVTLTEYTCVGYNIDDYDTDHDCSSETDSESFVFTVTE